MRSLSAKALSSSEPDCDRAGTATGRDGNISVASMREGSLENSGVLPVSRRPQAHKAWNDVVEAEGIHGKGRSLFTSVHHRAVSPGTSNKGWPAQKSTHKSKTSHKPLDTKNYLHSSTSGPTWDAKGQNVASHAPMHLSVKWNKKRTSCIHALKKGLMEGMEGIVENAMNSLALSFISAS